MALADVKTLDVLQQNVHGYLCTLCSMVPRFQMQVAEEVKDGLYAFCRRLAASLSSLAAVWLRGSSDAMNESMAPLWEMLVSFETELVESSVIIAGGSNVVQ